MQMKSGRQRHSLGGTSKVFHRFYSLSYCHSCRCVFADSIEKPVAEVDGVEEPTAQAILKEQRARRRAR